MSISKAGTQPRSLVYVFSMAAFVPYKRVLIMPKIFTNWLFTEKVC